MSQTQELICNWVRIWIHIYLIDKLQLLSLLFSSPHSNRETFEDRQVMYSTRAVTDWFSNLPLPFPLPFSLSFFLPLLLSSSQKWWCTKIQHICLLTFCINTTAKEQQNTKRNYDQRNIKDMVRSRNSTLKCGWLNWKMPSWYFPLSASLLPGTQLQWMPWQWPVFNCESTL